MFYGRTNAEVKNFFVCLLNGASRRNKGIVCQFCDVDLLDGGTDNEWKTSVKCFFYYPYYHVGPLNSISVVSDKIFTNTDVMDDDLLDHQDVQRCFFLPTF